jgi:hypothetical protein
VCSRCWMSTLLTHLAGMLLHECVALFAIVYTGCLWVAAAVVAHPNSITWQPAGTHHFTMWLHAAKVLCLTVNTHSACVPMYAVPCCAEGVCKQLAVVASALMDTVFPTGGSPSTATSSASRPAAEPQQVAAIALAWHCMVRLTTVVVLVQDEVRLGYMCHHMLPCDCAIMWCSACMLILSSATATAMLARPQQHWLAIL